MMALLPANSAAVADRGNNILIIRLLPKRADTRFRFAINVESDSISTNPHNIKNQDKNSANPSKNYPGWLY